MQRKDKRTVIAGYVLLMLHGICCIILYLLIKAKRIRVSKAIFPILFLIPLWGEICVLFLHFIIKTGKHEDDRFEMRRMKINSEIYKSIQIDQKADEAVVPLEEALLINDSSVRRSLIMDILNRHPDDYMSLLNYARLNDDAEVVHYAATAISELTREYDLKLQKLESEYHANPNAEDVLNRYTRFLDEYINQNMVQGQLLLMQRAQYEKLLKSQMEKHDFFELYEKRVHNELEMKLYSDAAELLEQMKKKWPELEQTWLLQIEYFARQQRGDKIQETIAEIKKRNIYLTSNGKTMIGFWDKGVRKTDEDNQKQTI